MSNKRILISPENKFWTYDNKIVTDVPFNTIPLQEDLTFWSSSEEQNLEIIDGLVRTAYDIRDTNKDFPLFMQQTLEVNRPSFLNNEIYFNKSASKLLSSISQSPKSAFIVMRLDILTGNRLAIGREGGELGSLLTSLTLRVGAVDNKTYLFNNNKYVAPISTSNALNTCIMHSLTPMSFNAIMEIGIIFPTGAFGKVLEWGWYNRVLTEKEALYNVNAMNSKYKIF